MKALVVDDSKMMRLAVGKILTANNVEFDEAGDGQQAWDTIDKNEGVFDFVLLDWNMPVMNGYEFLVKVRADSRFAQVKILMLTTENQLEAIRKAIMAGANEYIMKPFTDEMLIEKIKMVVPGVG